MPDLNTRPLDDDGEIKSVEKISWTEIAKIVRLRLESRLVALNDMTPDELLTYVKCLRESMALEMSAYSYDADLKHRNEEHWT